MDQVTQQLYEQTMDTQEGVVYLLLEEMAQQRVKEYLLAYALLLLKGAFQTHILIFTNSKYSPEGHPVLLWAGVKGPGLPAQA